MVNHQVQQQDTVPQYFKLLRYYSFTSLLSIIIVAIVLSVLTRHIVESNTIEMAEEKNVSMTQTLVNTLWQKHASFILSLSQLSGEEIRTHPQTQQLYDDIEHHMLGLEVLKVKIFDLQGYTLFSTDESQIGSTSREQGFQAARTGAIISELTFRDHTDSFEGIMVNRDVVATYIPIRGSPFEPVQGVIELYTDVTELLGKMRNSVTHSIISVLLVLIVLYFALFYIVRHGEKIIREQKQKIDFQENFDALTLLPNRQLFKDRLKHGIALARRNNELLAMLFINLDHFKSMNEGFGHDSGDLLLKEAASRLTANLHEYDTVARLGGDEFSLILEGIKDINRVTDICKRLLDVLSAPYIIDGAEVFVTASIGAALYPLNGQDERSILRAADAAISRAKEGGRNGFQFYSEDMATKAFERMSLETSLHRALERNEFEVYYQPKYDIDGKTITGAEALLRWHHPEMGTVNPDDFIPVLESSNLIVAVGEWVLRTACCQARTWQSITRRPFTIAVNISVRQFYDVGMIEKIKAILQDTGLPAASLELEITESVLMQDNVTSLDNLLRLHKENIRIAIDDFGTGYSSLSYLKRFPLHTLKIDRAFVRDLAIDQNDMEIIKAIIAMAKSLGLEVVAEGVETHEQLQFLQQQGCDQLQGFLLCKPQPATDLLPLIAGYSPDKVIVRFADQ